MFKAVNHLRQVDKRYQIYALIDPKDNSTRYIGSTGYLDLEAAMSVWDELIAESRELEEIASKIQQGESVGLSREEIEKLSADYYLWYGKCLSLLPEDLRQRVRSEYDGAWYAPKIKKFFEASSEPYIFRCI